MKKFLELYGDKVEVVEENKLGKYNDLYGFFTFENEIYSVYTDGYGNMKALKRYDLTI